jgi:putative transcriptional regulator
MRSKIRHIDRVAVEQGRYSPLLERAFQVAHVFKVPIDEVFHFTI